MVKRPHKRICIAKAKANEKIPQWCHMATTRHPSLPPQHLQSGANLLSSNSGLETWIWNHMFYPQLREVLEPKARWFRLFLDDPNGYDGGPHPSHSMMLQGSAGCMAALLSVYVCKAALLWRQHGRMSRIHNSANEAKLTVKYLSTIVLWLRGCKNTPVRKCKVVLWWWYIIS